MAATRIGAPARRPSDDPVTLPRRGGAGARASPAGRRQVGCRSHAGGHAGDDALKRQTLLGEARIPNSDLTLKLYRGKDDCSILVPGRGTLMTTRRHASEDALGTLACRALDRTDAASVLIGGLGMGFTLAAVLAATGPGARVTVAEIVPEVIEWNRGVLGEYSGRPLEDARTTVHHGDVVELLRGDGRRYDAIVLDVDNGPESIGSSGNDWLYSAEGIAGARDRLAPGGALAYWSATPDRRFAKRLRDGGLRVAERSVHAHGNKGARHTIWLAGTGRA